MTPLPFDHPDMVARLERSLVPPDMHIAEAVDVLDRAGTGVLLVVDSEKRLLGVITDGDHRRAILRRVSSSEPCLSIATRNPIVAPFNISRDEALRLMDQRRPFIVNQLSLLDSEGRVMGLVLRGDLTSADEQGVQAMVMAGGFGLRLLPMTADTPKPMLAVGDRPVMAHMLEHLKQAGIKRVNVTTHYRPEKITEYFGDGSAFGLDINYVPEERPLGTAGALNLVSRRAEPMLVINGDILTRVDFGAMIAYHREHKAEMTVAVRKYDVPVPFGVIECDGAYVSRISEKPTLNFFVNAGIYLIEPTVHELIPDGERFDMTDLIEKLIAAGRPVASFPVHEYWLDIGQHADYAQAQQDFSSSTPSI